MTGMAGALGFTVTADGVETEEQHTALRELTCERARGSALAAPVPAEKRAELLGLAASTPRPRELASR